MALEDLGIDPRVARILGSQGIQALYPPQEEAWKAVRGGSNVLVAIPTASGKSLVAYLAILHRLLARGGKALYIVPLRALASEKHDELQAFADLGLKVGIATGDLDERDPRLGRFDVIVCTSEKADALLRHRTEWVQDVTCVVADELHLMHDPGRGPTLEVILSRFRGLYKDCQVVGLSATVQNAKDIAAWLDAKLVTSAWRPTKLRTGTYFGDRLEFLGEPPRRLEAAGDPVASLVEETLKDGGQCLVFVSTRRSAESQAQKLGGLVRDLLPPEELAALEDVAKKIGGEDDADGGGQGATAQKLHKLVRAGVAYHTAGLDSHQRRTLEAAFRARQLKVLCATPTLAAGVNTPARRVIIRDLRRFEMGEGSRPLPVMEVKQMMGRAGRPRYDPYGEAVLLVKSLDEKEAAEEEYLRGDPEPVTSKLGADAALRMHSLASIAGGYAQDVKGLQRFFESTFWATEASDWQLRDAVEDVLLFLEDNGFVERTGDALRATPFGKRTSDLYIDPFSAVRLRQALAAKVEPTPFALLQAVCGCPDLMPLYLRQGDDWVQARFWEHHEEILVPADGRDLEAAMSYAKTAFLIEDWIGEVAMDQLEERYGVGPGDIRMRLDNGAWMLHAMTELARTFRPEWQGHLRDLGLRLRHGIAQELLPLVQLRGVGRVRARTLFRAGFKRPADLRNVPALTLERLPGFGPSLVADILRQVGAPATEGQATAPRRDDPIEGKGQTGLDQWA